MNRSRTARLLAAGLGVLVLIGAIIAMSGGTSRLRGSLGGRGTDESSVDAGFARDMAVHHAQAVQMAAYTEMHAPTHEVRALASNIALQQQLEIGEMLGWLDAWGLSRTSKVPAMSWMQIPGHQHHAMSGMPMMAGPMPGMATPGEMDALLNLNGKKLEIRFLQLMVRHHQGGLPMARDGAEHASHRYVRDFAGQMVIGQAEEIDRMTQMLSARGAKPLAAP